MEYAAMLALVAGTGIIVRNWKVRVAEKTAAKARGMFQIGDQVLCDVDGILLRSGVVAGIHRSGLVEIRPNNKEFGITRFHPDLVFPRPFLSREPER